jgi:hypothetical protein
VNEPSEVLDAFKTYFTTAQLSDVTDREIILTLRTKLDALGYYDEHEIDRVVKVVLDTNSKQKQLRKTARPSGWCVGQLKQVIVDRLEAYPTLYGVVKNSMEQGDSCFSWRCSSV